jgi:hypothetical protein
LCESRKVIFLTAFLAFHLNFIPFHSHVVMSTQITFKKKEMERNKKRCLIMQD